MSPTVLDEVRAGLVLFQTTLADEVPAFYRDLEAALAETYPDEAPIVPPLLTFGSWIGGHRDGNPHVTPAMTVEALRLMREQCLRFLEERVGILAQRISLSERIAGPAEGLAGLLAAGSERFPEQLHEPTQEVVATFRMLRAALTGEHRGAVEAYVVSGTEGPADLLEVLLLMKEAGLARAGGHDAALRIVPLFEAGATLEAAPQTMGALLDAPCYRTALWAVGDEQEVMIG